MLTLSAAAFLATLGVCAHIPYTDGGYVNLPGDLADLRYLGIDQVRDGLSSGANGSASLQSYIFLAEHGIKFTLVTEQSSTEGLTAYMEAVDRLQQEVPGSVQAVEGPNEINNWPVTYNGVKGLAGALLLQSAIYTYVKSDPQLRGVKVVYMTGYPGGSPDPTKTPGLADFDNQHPYPNFGQPPHLWVRREALGNTTDPEAPAVFTETGYTTAQVNPQVQAKYLLDLYFDAASLGITRTFVYELKDAYAPKSRVGDAGWGLFEGFGTRQGDRDTPKPAAVAIHNLTTLLADYGTAKIGKVRLQISGLPASGNTLLIEKSDGTDYLVVWAEPVIWWNRANIVIPAPEAPVTVTLPASQADVRVFDPLTGTAPVAEYTHVTQIRLRVTDHPLLVAFGRPTS
jgi:hypothetical protein